MNKARYFFFALIVIISGTVYYSTLCPTVEFIDSGELALAAKNLGIAHPTGYPLYTLLGRIISIIPISDLIIRLNFLSLLFTAFAAGSLYLLISEFVIGEHRKLSDEAIAAATALFVAFSPDWWSQGTTNEVYSLNLLLISLSIWCLARYTRKGSLRLLLMASYMLGLALANHLSAVYLIPGFIFLIFVTLPKAKVSAITWTILFLALPGTLYVVLPIRAGFKPFLNWGAVNNPYFFYKHITGWQYQIWMFDKPFEIFSNIGAKLGPAWNLFLEQFGWLGAILITIGIIGSAARNKRLLIFAAIIWLLNLVYVLNYEIADIESYYLPMFLISSIFLALGAISVAGWLFRRFGKTAAIAWIAAGVFFILPIYNLSANYQKLDRSKRTAARQVVIDLASSMETGGFALMDNWDFYSPWLYLHFENQFRPDIVLFDKELMRRSWYIDFIKRYHGDIFERSKPEFEEFLRRVAPFEQGKSFDPAFIDTAYYGMLHAIMAHESAVRPVYTNISNDPKVIAGFTPIPEGILFRLTSTESFIERPQVTFDNSFWQSQSVYDPMRIGHLLSFYGRAFESRQKYCEYFGKLDESAYYRNLELRVKEIVDDDLRKTR